MKTIAFVIPTLTNGGAERVATYIANGLSKEYNVKILCFYKTDKNYQLDDNVEVIYMFNKNDNIFKKIKTIRKTIKQVNPNVIFPFLQYVCIYTVFSLLFTKYKKRVCCTLRVNPKYTSNQMLYKLAVRQSNKLIVQNQGEKSYFSKKIQNKCVIIPNPISKEIESINKKYNDKLENICCVGRITWQKNYEQMIKALSKLDSSVYLHIYGNKENAEESKNINDLAKKLGVEKQIIYEGYTTKLIQEMANHDLFILTSRYEGMPNALMEAMGCGLPVISSNCDYGPQDLIKDHETGLLYCLDSDDDLVDKIKYIQNNYSDAIRMGKNARKDIIESYEINKVIKQWEKLIEVITND